MCCLCGKTYRVDIWSRLQTLSQVSVGIIDLVVLISKWALNVVKARLEFQHLI